MVGAVLGCRCQAPVCRGSGSRWHRMLIELTGVALISVVGVTPLLALAHDDDDSARREEERARCGRDRGGAPEHGRKPSSRTRPAPQQASQAPSDAITVVTLAGSSDSQPDPPPAPPPAISTSSTTPSHSSNAPSAASSGSGAIGALSRYDSSGRISPFKIWGPDGFDDAVAREYDSFWSINKNGWQSAAPYSARYHAAKPTIVLGKYMPMFRDDSQRGPNNTIAWWKANHPDWIVYQCDRTTPAYEYGYATNVPLDISNPDVVAFQVDAIGAAARAQGYDTLSVDNFSLANGWGRCGIWKDGTWVELYAGGRTTQRFRDDSLAWLKMFQDGLHSLSTPIAMTINWTPYENGHPVDDTGTAARDWIVAHTDAILDESGFTHDGRWRISGGEWEYVVSLMRYAQSQGKPYLSINIGSSHDDLSWIVGSYLVANDGKAGLNVSDTWFTEFGARVGSACGAPSAIGSVHTRAFDHAFVCVNSGTGASSCTVPSGSWTDLAGSQVQPGEHVLSGTSGLVLTTAASRCP